MIDCCLIRLAMLGPVKLSVGQLSFTRALTETRLFLRTLLNTPDTDIWASIREAHLSCCAQYRVRYKPGRQFSRDRQEYRRKTRGLEKRRRGRKCKCKQASPTPKPETHKGLKGQIILLSWRYWVRPNATVSGAPEQDQDLQRRGYEPRGRQRRKKRD